MYGSGGARLSLGEHSTPLRWAGILLVTLGVRSCPSADSLTWERGRLARPPRCGSGEAIGIAERAKAEQQRGREFRVRHYDPRPRADGSGCAAGVLPGGYRLCVVVLPQARRVGERLLPSNQRT